MGRFLRTLAKVGLVELDEHERGSADAAAERLDSDVTGALEAELMAAADAPPTIDLSRVMTANDEAGAVCGIESVDFDALYRQAQIAASPFPAEKLLRVLDGLRAMDLATRKAAVMAIDAADEQWTIEDPVLDAQRKVKALQAAKSDLSRVVAEAAEQAERDSAAQDAYRGDATTAIREQIAQLEATLQEEVTKVAQEKAAIASRLQAMQQACQREVARFELEIMRLSELPQMFLPPHRSARFPEDG